MENKLRCYGEPRKKVTIYTPPKERRLITIQVVIADWCPLRDSYDPFQHSALEKSKILTLLFRQFSHLLIQRSLFHQTHFCHCRS